MTDEEVMQMIAKYESTKSQIDIAIKCRRNIEDIRRLCSEYYSIPCEERERRYPKGEEVQKYKLRPRNELPNQDIRQALKDNGIRHSDINEYLGRCHGYLAKVLMKELSEPAKRMWLQKIKECKKDKDERKRRFS